MSHTPGPWVLSVDCDEYNILDREATFDEYGVMTGSRPNVIAEAFFVPSVQSAADPMSGYATKLANARLIAAAPDLLEGAILQSECGYPEPSHAYDEECVECWRWTHPDGRTWFELGGHDEPPPPHPVLAAAIAKAKEGSA